MFQPQTTATFSDNSQQNEKLVTSCDAFPPSRNLSYQNSVCNTSARNNSHSAI